MKIRKTKPSNNKHYIRMDTGGLNGAIEGFPCDPTANVLCNCVGYANGRFNEIINDPELKGIEKKFKYQLVRNAERFIESAKAQGLKISDKPTLGGIMVWSQGDVNSSSDGCGHVEVVEQQVNTNEIITSGSVYGFHAFRTTRRTNDNGRWGMGQGFVFRGCIVNPSIANIPIADPTPAPAPAPTPQPTEQKNDIPKKGEKWKIVRKNGLYMYAEPSKKAHKITRLDCGTVFTVHDVHVGKSSCFAKLKKGEKWGWILIYDSKGTYCVKKGGEKDNLVSQKKWIDTLVKLADDMKRAGTIYNWKSPVTEEVALKESTCVSYVSLALQRIGYMEKGKYVNWQDTGKLHGTGAGYVKSHPEQFKLIDCGKSPQKAGLKVGDVVGYKSHTMVFAGWKKDGKTPLWYSLERNGANGVGKKVKLDVKGEFSYYNTRKIDQILRPIYIK